ncbi:hypothetical protein V7714_20525, partial [Chitinimonas sp. JJ19]
FGDALGNSIAANMQSGPKVSTAGMGAQLIESISAPDGDTASFAANYVYDKFGAGAWDRMAVEQLQADRVEMLASLARAASGEVPVFGIDPESRYSLHEDMLWDFPGTHSGGQQFIPGGGSNSAPAPLQYRPVTSVVPRISQNPRLQALVEAVGEAAGAVSTGDPDIARLKNRVTLNAQIAEFEKLAGYKPNLKVVSAPGVDNSYLQLVMLAEQKNALLLQKNAPLVQEAEKLSATFRTLTDDQQKGFVGQSIRSNIEKLARQLVIDPNATRANAVIFKQYINEVESFSNFRLGMDQRNMLKDFLRQDNNGLRKLSPQEAKAHRWSNSTRDSLIKQWEELTAQKWPTYAADKLSKRGAVYIRKGEYFDAHEIIPNQYNAPHEWWNIVPAERPNAHQGGIHGVGSGYSKIVKKF